MFRKSEIEFDYAESKDTYTNAVAILKQLETLGKQVTETTTSVDNLVKVIPEVKDAKKMESTLKASLQSLKNLDNFVNSDNGKTMLSELQKSDKKFWRETYSKLNAFFITTSRTTLPKLNKSMSALLDKMKSEAYLKEVNKYSEILHIEEVQQLINKKYNIEALAAINKLAKLNNETVLSLITNIEKINNTDYKHSYDDFGPDNSRI